MKESLKKNPEETTVRQRNIVISLSDDDLEGLVNKAGSVGLTVGELLANFVRDLVYSDKSNGSDERSLANDYYDRCYGGYCYNDTLLSYLIGHYGIDEVDNFVDTLAEIERVKKSINSGEIDYFLYAETTTIKDLIFELKGYERYYKSVVNDYLSNNPNADITNEINYCKSFISQYYILKSY